MRENALLRQRLQALRATSDEKLALGALQSLAAAKPAAAPLRRALGLSQGGKALKQAAERRDAARKAQELQPGGPGRCCSASKSS